jgi:hypothetical protein
MVSFSLTFCDVEDSGELPLRTGYDTKGGKLRRDAAEGERTRDMPCYLTKRTRIASQVCFREAPLSELHCLPS